MKSIVINLLSCVTDQFAVTQAPALNITHCGQGTDGWAFQGIGNLSIGANESIGAAVIDMLIGTVSNVAAVNELSFKGRVSFNKPFVKLLHASSVVSI